MAPSSSTRRNGPTPTTGSIQQVFQLAASPHRIALRLARTTSRRPETAALRGGCQPPAAARHRRLPATGGRVPVLIGLKPAWQTGRLAIVPDGLTLDRVLAAAERLAGVA